MDNEKKNFMLLISNFTYDRIQFCKILSQRWKEHFIFRASRLASKNVVYSEADSQESEDETENAKKR